MIFLPGPALKPASLSPALVQFTWENQVAEIIAYSISGAGKVHSRTGQKLSEIDSIQSGEKLIVFLRQVSSDVLYLQVEARAPDGIMVAVGFCKERKRRGKGLSGLPLIVSERTKELQ